MQERSSESNDINELDLTPRNNPPVCFIRSWLNTFDKTKLECSSVIFGISGLSLITLGICILIIIHTTYEDHLTNIIECSILNITHTHIKLCESHRCRVFNSCLPYVCTIIFVRYHYNNISYESKLYSFNNYLNSSCSYEPTSCISLSRIQFEQKIFLKTFIFNNSPTKQCCFHSLTQQPRFCHTYLNPTQYSMSIISMISCFIIGLILILIGIQIQLHLNNYFKSHHQHKEDFLNNILNFHFSNGTIRSSIEKITPVNYDILTQTMSHHNTPSTTKIHPNQNSLLFDIEEENEIFKKECLRSNYQEQIQNEIIRQYQLGDEEIKIILEKIENDFKQQNSFNLPKNSMERIKYLLQTIDHLELYFPAIHKQISNSTSLNQQSSPISVFTFTCSFSNKIKDFCFSL